MPDSRKPHPTRSRMTAAERREQVVVGREVTALSGAMRDSLTEAWNGLSGLGTKPGLVTSD